MIVRRMAGRCGKHQQALIRALRPQVTRTWPSPTHSKKLYERKSITLRISQAGSVTIGAAKNCRAADLRQRRNHIGHMWSKDSVLCDLPGTDEPVEFLGALELRTKFSAHLEFYWQKATAHATQQEAMEETRRMLDTTLISR